MSAESLAILGGPQAYPEPLHVGRPYIGNREHFFARLEDILDRRWLTNQGKYCEELEHRLCDLLGVKHCIATCNGTIALQLAIRAAGITGEAIVPSFTFIATAHALEWQHVRPVFADVNLDTHCIDPSSVEAAITPRTTAIIGVHLWGNPCEVEALTDIAEKHNLWLLFDAAHAIGCKYNGFPIGRFGDAEIFSFHATKIINSFEGGCITTNNDELAAKLILMRNFGFTGYDTVTDVGTNGKMSEPCAAMCLTNLESLDAFVETNQAHRDLYIECLRGLPGITVFESTHVQCTNHQYLVLLVDENECPLDRDSLLATLWAEGIIARRYFYPGCHNMEPYKSRNGKKSTSLENTKTLCKQVLVLPTGNAIRRHEIITISRIIQAAIVQSHSIISVLDENALKISEAERRRRTGLV